MTFKQFLAQNAGSLLTQRDNKLLATQSAPTDIDEVCDLPYLDDGQASHRLDVYRPRSFIEPLPTIIHIHGGGFIYGTKDIDRLYCLHLAKQGFIVANVDYSLAPNTLVPNQLNELFYALHWLSANKGTFGLESENVFLSSQSAGGVFTTMIALILKSERLQNIYNVTPAAFIIRATVINCGYMTFYDSVPLNRALRWFIFEKGYTNQANYQNLIFDTLPELCSLPPTLLATAQDDPLHYMTENFKQLLEEVEVEHDLISSTRTQGQPVGHVFSILQPNRPESAIVIDGIAQFLHKKEKYGLLH